MAENDRGRPSEKAANGSENSTTNSIHDYAVSRRRNLIHIVMSRQSAGAEVLADLLEVARDERDSKAHLASGGRS